MLTVINNFNLLTWPKAMAEWLSHTPDLEIVLLDNNSNYPPLLEWYKTCPYEVVRLERNANHLAPWTTGLIKDCCRGEPYIVTDPDLDLAGIPADWPAVLLRGLNAPGTAKCGFSLRIDDLPDAPGTPWVLQDQQRWWKGVPADACYMSVWIDTTFAMYLPNSPWGQPARGGTAHLRTTPPYTARHLPWYLLPGELPEEYANYIRTSSRYACTAMRWKKNGWR